ncbi:16S rRNA (cytidine(1402)-2'-O)-methyltransferase [Lichenifustis flavocetrariae]|uniref:Ribosomal RNA small subunit methyltransferase I n=1 Tax=Lichenifustis flavocetrariae TaxID=2949735 RepID=A0AA41YYJ0_9HYPH|nr:16S rRNA (cytidine(1402)-2'-O)-methyltransferase [Lichenifustis flavocetrariae]MCW6509577.1 16S rRNA (cytidine(1402)-2'-O)-methyltransferase [Lichenifustis flavocetrariae]
MTRSGDEQGTSGPRPAGASFTALGLRAEAETLTPGLHVVATPIGNLGDISFRAVATLAAADTIIAEDTRVTKVLLAHYGIATPLVTYHEHNAAVMRPHLLARLKAGAALALVSDAGTPLVSDPGYKLVSEALAEHIPVIPIPGASAVLAALVVAGLPTDRFFFEGFLPPKSAARRARIAVLAAVPGTLVFFESGRRITETLADLAAVLGPRQAAIARELTKHYETVRRGPLPELAATLATEDPPKGEIVLLVGPPDTEISELTPEELDVKLRAALERLAVKDASAVVAAETGLPRRQIYARAVELTAERRGRLNED